MTNYLFKWLKSKKQEKGRRANTKCSPKYSRKGQSSCLPDWAIKQLALKYNTMYPEDPLIEMEQEKDDFFKFWEALNEKFRQKKICRDGDEKCWTRKLNPSLPKLVFDNSTDSTLYQITPPSTFETKFFAHSVPKKWKENIESWLTNYDIQNVMSQYMDKYEDFLFIGPVPNDFELEGTSEKCIVKELCPRVIHKFVKKWHEQKKTKIGVIFNTDPHDKAGAHWIAAFLNIDYSHPEVFFYDSYGIPPSLEISTFLKRIAGELEKDTGRKVPVKINMNRHQFTGAQCGVYCIHFILSMLERPLVEDDSFEKYLSDTFSGGNRDEFMRNNRKLYWNWENDALEQVK